MTEKQPASPPSQKPVSPAAAGFDGSKGLRMPGYGVNFRIHLRRAKATPAYSQGYNFKEQLLWFYPDDAPAKLLWCNGNDQWFELSFNPIEKPWSLAEEALKDLAVLLDIAKRGGVFNPPDTIRLALERLQKLEQVNNG